MRWIVPQKLRGTTLLSFLRDHVPTYPSVRSLKKAIEQKSCRINGKLVTFSTKSLTSGDEIVFAPPTAIPAGEKIKIVYEDDYLLVCNKPSGVVSENTEFHKKLEKKHSKTLLIHRLDKDTSGLIMLAKNLGVKEKMIELFEDKAIEKEYLAIVAGKTKASGKVENFLSKKYEKGGKPYFGSSPSGKYAATVWKKISSTDVTSLVSCQLLTGRTHQIRVHFSEMGHPIIGDDQYGENLEYRFHVPRHMLHAYRLSFCHPYTQNTITLCAPLPKDFEEARKYLRLPFEENSILC